MNNIQSYQSFKLLQNRQENNSTKSLIFDKPLFHAQPGQFVMAWLPGIGEKPYSILDDDPFSLSVASVGIFSAALINLKVGSRVWIRGPLGQGFRLNGKRHLLIAGGYGAVPLYFLAEQARKSKDEVKICLGARTAEDLLMAGAFKSLGCEVFIATDDGSLGEKGLVTHAVSSVMKHFNDFYRICMWPCADVSFSHRNMCKGKPPFSIFMGGKYALWDRFVRFLRA